MLVRPKKPQRRYSAAVGAIPCPLVGKLNARVTARFKELEE